MRCETCQPLILDDLYGLLEPAESAAVAAHVAGCPACTTARQQAVETQKLLGWAAKQSFPNIEFRAPVEPSTVVADERTRTEQQSVRTIGQWALSVCLLLMVTGTVVPLSRALIHQQTAQARLNAIAAKAGDLERDYSAMQAEFRRILSIEQDHVRLAKVEHDRVVEEWIAVEKQALIAQPIQIVLRGPTSIKPGASNDFTVSVVDADNTNIAAKLEWTIRNPQGQSLASSTAETNGTLPVAVRIPASVWTGTPAPRQLTLQISATDLRSGRVTELRETIDVQAPAYVTMVTTDRPVYRPGETIHFRSVTLDQSRFTPPQRDLTLCFRLLGANGQVVRFNGVANELSVTGTTRIETVNPDTGKLEPVMGPDGKLLRGIGGGRLLLPGTIAAGRYTLAVYEIPLGRSELESNARPLARRSVEIRASAPHRLTKTLTFDKPHYQSGELVTAKVTVRDQGKPVANAVLMVSATAEGRGITGLRTTPPVTDVNGSATIQFTLPPNRELTAAQLTCNILHSLLRTGDLPPNVTTDFQESIVRAVPLLPSKLRMEFFPEGGDLIAGVPNRIYLRITGPDGRPFDARGVITDGNTPLVNFETRQGKAIVTLTPVAGTKYHAALNNVPTVKENKYDLPEAKKDGVVLTIPRGVVTSQESMEITIRSVGPTSRKLYVGAYARNETVAQAVETLEPGHSRTIRLQPAPESPGGVTRITVFEEPASEQTGRVSLRPVAERLIFRKVSNRLDLKVDLRGENSQDRLVAGQQGQLTVSARTESGQPTAAVLYAAVVAESAMAGQREPNLPSYFLIENEVDSTEGLDAAAILVADGADAARDLDLLLGTQGWRRFAEQSPTEFRNRSTDAADRLTVAASSHVPFSADYKPQIQRVIQRYRPQYDLVRSAYEAAEQKQQAVKTESHEAQQLKLIETNHRSVVQEFMNVRDELRNGWENPAKSGIWPITAAAFMGLGVSLILLRFTSLIPDSARSRVSRVAIVLLGLGLVTIAALAFMANESSIEALPTLPKPTDTTSPTPPATVAQPVIPASPNAVVLESVGSSRFIPIVRNGNYPIDDGRTLVNDSGKSVFRSSPRTDDGVAQWFYKQRMNQLKQALSPAIAAVVANHPPLVVREYAHTRSTSWDGTADVPRDATETVFWQPLLMVPGGGESLTQVFQFNQVSDRYRIIVAGHTLDGRLGHVSILQSVEPAPETR